MDLGDLFDSYSRQARLQPALLTLFPLFASVAVWVPALYDLAAGLVGLAVACGAIAYLAHLSRALGRRAETKLVSAWGGVPTTRWLRHRDSTIDPMTKERYRACLARTVPGWKTPTIDDEANNPALADGSYESAVRWLRENTRDHDKFPLVFKENVSYGFRRNLYGLRPLGIGLSSLCILGNAVALYRDVVISGNSSSPAEIAAFALALGFLAIWGFGVTGRWVRDAGEAYARALLATCEVM